MINPLSLELFADDLLRERRNFAANQELIAQLPHTPSPRPDLAARVRLASGLRALALRLDPCGVSEPSLAVLGSR